ncbi:hypothetical protein EVA_12409, partial [gut metagenome]
MVDGFVYSYGGIETITEQSIEKV